MKKNVVYLKTISNIRDVIHLFTLSLHLPFVLIESMATSYLEFFICVVGSVFSWGEDLGTKGLIDTNFSTQEYRDFVNG